MNYVTPESIKRDIRSLPQTTSLRTEDLKAIRMFCQEHGAPGTLETIFYATLAAEAIGFRKGKNYQKRHGNVKSDTINHQSVKGE